MKTLTALILLLTAAAQAQVRETTTVEVVEVPVYVTARGGSVVTGLTKNQFELFVNGKPQQIDYFDVIDFGAAPPTPAAATAVRDRRQRRLYFFVFDLLFSPPSSILRAQAAAEKFVGAAGESDEFAVATFSHNHGIDIIVPFSRDRATVQRAIHALRPSGVGDAFRMGIDPQEIAQLQEVLSDSDVEFCDPQSACAEALKDRSRFLIENQIADLGALALRLSSLEGQKHVVLLSDGFSADLVHGVNPRPRSSDVMNASGPSVTSKMVLPKGPPDLDGRMLADLRKLYAMFGAAGVFLDAVDTAGLRAGASFEENEALVMLARDTGGDVIERRSDLNEALQLLTDRDRVVYVLGFHAHGAGGKENSIRVRLRGVSGRPDLRYRQTFTSVVPAQASVDPIRIADILTNDIPQDGVAIDAAGDSSGRVNVTIPLATLLPQFDRVATLEVFVYVFSDNRAIASKGKRIDIDRQRVQAAGRNAIAFSESFALPPGNYVAKTVVHIAGTTSLGFARTEFAVR